MGKTESSNGNGSALTDVYSNGPLFCMQYNTVAFVTLHGFARGGGVDRSRL